MEHFSRDLLKTMVAFVVESRESFPEPRLVDPTTLFDRRSPGAAQRMRAEAAGKPDEIPSDRKRDTMRKLAQVNAARCVCRHWRENVDFSSILSLHLDFSKLKRCPPVPRIFSGCRFITLVMPGHWFWYHGDRTIMDAVSRGLTRPSMPDFLRSMPQLRTLVLQASGHSPSLPGWVGSLPLTKLTLFSNSPEDAAWVTAPETQLPQSLRVLDFGSEGFSSPNRWCSFPPPCLRRLDGLTDLNIGGMRRGPGLLEDQDQDTASWFAGLPLRRFAASTSICNAPAISIALSKRPLEALDLSIEAPEALQSADADWAWLDKLLLGTPMAASLRELRLRGQNWLQSLPMCIRGLEGLTCLEFWPFGKPVEEVLEAPSGHLASPEHALLPEWLGTMPHLEVLSLRFAIIESLPATFGTNTMLRCIDLSESELALDSDWTEERIEAIFAGLGPLSELNPHLRFKIFEPTECLGENPLPGWSGWWPEDGIDIKDGIDIYETDDSDEGSEERGFYHTFSPSVGDVDQF